MMPGMMFESPGKITNLQFQSKNSSGKWVTQYSIKLDSHPTYQMVLEWFYSFSGDSRFCKATQYRITAIRPRKLKDGTWGSNEDIILSRQSVTLNCILGRCALITVKGPSINKVYADENSSFPSFRDFWKSYIWNKKGEEYDELAKVKQYTPTAEDGWSTVYKLIFKSGKVLTIGCWATAP